MAGFIEGHAGKVSLDLPEPGYAKFNYVGVSSSFGGVFTRRQPKPRGADGRHSPRAA